MTTNTNQPTNRRTAGARHRRNRELLERVLGVQLADLREQLDLSQQELADRLKLTREAVSAFERGRASPSLPTVVNLLELLQA